MPVPALDTAIQFTLPDNLSLLIASHDASSNMKSAAYSRFCPSKKYITLRCTFISYEKGHVFTGFCISNVKWLPTRNEFTRNRSRRGGLCSRNCLYRCNSYQETKVSASATVETASSPKPARKSKNTR